MDKQTIRAAMEQSNREEGRRNTEKKSYEKYTFAETASEKQLRGAIDTYAQDVKEEEIIALLDTTFLGSGKDGFLFTEHRMYGKCLKSGPVDLERLKYATTRVKDKNAANVLIYEDGTMYDLSSSESVNIKKVMPLLKKLTGCEQGERRPAEKDAEFYRRYDEVIRRRVREIVNRYSEEDGELFFPETIDSQALGRLIQKTREDIRPEDIVAVRNAGTGHGKTGAIFTRYAYYPCYYSENDMVPLYYDGLDMILSPQSMKDYLLAVYENGYVQKIIDLGEITKDKEILIEIVSAFRELQKEPPKGTETLSSVKGWEEFIARRSKGALEAYKNSVFVSSTFKDMHFERDTIHEKVLPVLNQIGMEYGQTISFCDLRWGVSTGELDSEEGARKVLSVCLNEIERCRPYMIVILGERYGWIPEERTIANALEGQPDFTLDELEKSVTALEIEFGALVHTDQMERTFFYFREIKGNPSDIYKSEDAHHAGKLAELKERIRKLAGKQVKSYTLSWNEESDSPSESELTAFAHMVTEDVRSAMEEEWQKQAGRTPFEREQMMHWELAEKKALQCAARDELVLGCLKQLEQGERMLVITGESGSGKSTLMGCLAVTLRLSGAKVLPVFCGYTARSDTALEAAQSMVQFLRSCLESEEEEASKSMEAEEEAGQLEKNATIQAESEKEWLEELNRLTAQYTARGTCPVVFVIDAIDQLLADELRDSLKFLPYELTDKVKVVLTCLSDFPLPYVANQQSLPLMRESDKPEVIQGILKLHRRELEKPVIGAIAAKPYSDHPLYMNLLIQRLLMMNKNDFDDIAGQGDGISAITRHQLKLVEESADDLSGICREILHAAADRIGSGFVEKAMECLAVSRHGLRESDLEGILTSVGILWNTLDFSLFINYLRSMFLIRDDGRIDFSHKSFREGVCRNLKQEKELHERIWTWLYALPGQDEVRVQEYIYHGIRADKKAELIADIQEKKEEEAFIKRTAKEFAFYSRTDDGRWVAEGFNDYNIQGSIDHRYLHFLWEPLHLELGSFGEAGKIEERIYLAALPAAETLTGWQCTVENVRNETAVYSRLGYIYQGRKTREDYEKALTYYKKSLAAGREMEEKLGDFVIRRGLSVDYRLTGDVYLKIDRERNHDMAVQCYEESIRIAEKVAAGCPEVINQRALGWSYKRMAELYRTDKELEKALEYFEKCIEIREAIVKKSSSVTDRRNLCYSYDDAACIYRGSSDKEKISLAVRLFAQEAVLWKEIVKDEKDEMNLCWLGDSYANAAGCCYKLGEASDKEHALEYYEKAIPILEEVRKAGKTEVEWTLALSCKRAAEIAFGQAGASNLVKFEDRSQKALGLYEKLAKEEETEDAYTDWVAMLFFYFKCVPETEKGIQCLEQCTELMRMLYKKTGNKEYKSNITRMKLLKKIEGVACKL